MACVLLSTSGGKKTVHYDETPKVGFTSSYTCSAQHIYDIVRY